MQALIWPSISPSSGSFIFYKLRELWWIDSHKNENNIDALVSFLKLCPALEQLFVTVSLISLLGNNWCSYFAIVFKLTEIVITGWTQIDTEGYSYSAPRSNSCLKQATKYTELQHLKLIKFRGFTSRVDEISVAKRLIGLVKGKTPKIETSDGSCLVAM